MFYWKHVLCKLYWKSRTRLKFLKENPFNKIFNIKYTQSGTTRKSCRKLILVTKPAKFSLKSGVSNGCTLMPCFSSKQSWVRYDATKYINKTFIKARKLNSNLCCIIKEETNWDLCRKNGYNVLLRSRF